LSKSTVEKTFIKARKKWKIENIYNDYLFENLKRELEVPTDLTLYPLEREMDCDKKRVDILAEDPLRNKVVIESQYGKADDDHFGRLLQYFNHHKAKFGILIAESIKPIMLLAVREQNRLYAPEERGFFVAILRCQCVVETIKFQDPWNDHYYEIVERPAFDLGDKYRRELHQDPEKNTKVDFLKGLLEVSNLRTPIFRNAKIADAKGYVKSRAFKPGIAWRYKVEKDIASVSLGFFLKKDKDSYKLNKDRYGELKKYQEEINLKFSNLEWRDGNTPSIVYTMPGASKVREWSSMYTILVDAFLDMYRLLNPYISQLP